MEPIRTIRNARAAALACILSLALAPASPVAAADAKAPAKAAAKSSVFFSDRPDAATFLAARQAELDGAQKAIDRMLAVKGKRTIENTLAPFNEAQMLVDNAAYGAYIMEQTHPDSAFRAQAEPMTVKASKFSDDLSLNRDVYDAFARVDVKKADAATRYFYEKTMRDFRRAGVDKDEATRKVISSLLDELNKTGQEFSKNIREDSRTIQVDAADLKGLPDDFVKAHPAGPDGKVT
ncbi:MAG TPA: hypothetical protein VLG15_15620, partial [Thermoanaerobaculia bacterium]|nr:hypothetical protein [Thermoanaerobaculia bacterium]